MNDKTTPAVGNGANFVARFSGDAGRANRIKALMEATLVRGDQLLAEAIANASEPVALEVGDALITEKGHDTDLYFILAGKAGISFPITVGVVDSETLAGQIRHAGGLKLSKGDTKVFLIRYFIDIDDTPSLSGLVGVGERGGDRAELFSLDLANLKVEPGKDSITLSGITLKLTAGAAAALNGAFGDGAAPFTEGLVMGTATVKARTWSVPAWGW